MSAYQQILAAVDFGEHTDAVVPRALQQAECGVTRLTVLHVVHYIRSIDDDYVIPGDDPVEAALLASASETLDDTLCRLGAAHAQTVVITGRPKHEILQVAEREAADLIVIGAHGRHSLGGLLGSTTERVVHRATCSALTVR